MNLAMGLAKSGKQRKTVLRLSLAAPLFALAATAHAQYYGGISIGQSKAGINGGDISSQFLDLGFSTPAISLTDKKTSYGVKLGYQFTPNFAVEGNYTDLGKFSYNATVVPTGTFASTLKVDGFGLDVVGTLPISGGFSLIGRAGVQRMKTDGAFSGSGSVDLFNTGATQTSTAGKFGIGVQYDVSKNLGLRLEAERFRKLGGNTLGSAFDADNYSFGVLFKF
jgi:OmpA-OmpF porin, OOP family